MQFVTLEMNNVQNQPFNRGSYDTYTCIYPDLTR